MESMNREDKMQTKRGKNLKLVSNPGIETKKSEKISSAVQKDSDVYLLPEQIEEIHVDEYSLMLFYATRIEPLSLAEIKLKYPEPEAKKAQKVIDRFLKARLIHVASDGKYYSNYPENYINYSKYRYDSDLEARKDAKVFQTMKEQMGKQEFWKDKAYFSIDAFFSEEQSNELLAMFREIKKKAKQFSNENMKKKSVGGLKFRRIKFYDMFFSVFLAVLFTVFWSSKGFAGGGNDPGAARPMVESVSYFQSDARIFDMDDDGGGHDPGGNNRWANLRGGGHDPGGGTGSNNLFHQEPCFWVFGSKVLFTKDQRVCRLQQLKSKIQSCEQTQGDCDQLRREFDRLDQELGEVL